MQKRNNKKKSYQFKLYQDQTQYQQVLVRISSISRPLYGAARAFLSVILH